MYPLLLIKRIDPQSIVDDTQWVDLFLNVFSQWFQAYFIFPA